YAKLVGSGDRVQRIEGCPSGTLGYLFGELGRCRRFSQALRGAIAKGYPEPDPREDLSGMDVARKALILGRLLGFPGELKDIAVESLVPPGAERLTPEEFLARLEEYDAPWTRRLSQARRRGGALRYRAIVTRRRIRVGLVVVDASSPMAPRGKRRAGLRGVALPRGGAADGRARDRELSRREHAAPRVSRARPVDRASPTPAQARGSQSHRIVQGPGDDRGGDAGPPRRRDGAGVRIDGQHRGLARRVRRSGRAAGTRHGAAGPGGAR